MLVYHMGKVGSTSIFESLVAAGVDNIHHFNRMNPEVIERVRAEYRRKGLPIPPGDDEGLRVYADLRAAPTRIKCISPVRDPVRRNLSAFFFSYELFTGDREARPDADMAALRERFLAAYPHDLPLTWFDEELRTTLGVDVYRYPFPKEKGHTVVRCGLTEVLLLTCELDDAVKEKAIGRFMNLPAFRLRNENVGQASAYAAAYGRFLSQVKLPGAYLDRLCDSRYTRHFYTDSDIAAMKAAWREAPAGSRGNP